MRLAQNLMYVSLSILSTCKNSFEQFGRLAKKTGRTISRWLMSEEKTFELLRMLCLSTFHTRKRLDLIIDDTLIKKIFSQYIEGTGWFFDTKMYRSNPALRVNFAALSDGKRIIPISNTFLFSSDIEKASGISNMKKEDFIKHAYLIAKKLFPSTEITILCDGLFATTELLGWASREKILIEARMHSNRTVWYQGVKYSLKKLALIKRVRLTNNRMQRTVRILWNEIDLYVTIVKRIDKHGSETTVFQVSTEKCEPRQHVAHYKKRWAIEKMFRTTKQFLGLKDCFSRSFEMQKNHVASVMLSYVLLQLEAKRLRLKTPEAAARRCKEKNADEFLAHLIDQYGHLFKNV